MTVKLGMTHAQLINAINSDIDLIKDQGSKIITKEFPASETETSSVQLDTKCQGKDYMFVFMDYGILEPSKYSLSADGLTVNFSPAIPANHKIIIRYFTPGSSFTNYVTDEFQSNLLNYTTNRILEIPQDIKLELNNGTLTLKAGSKVYVPNGPDVFDEVVISADKTLGKIGSYTGSSLLLVRADGSRIVQSVEHTSGSTAPTTSSGMWYDTTNNKIFSYTNGNVDTVQYSLPVALVSRTNGSWTSIDQVFNGFGYIGSTVFALPGVKVQIPNGRNENRTCRSIIATVDSVKTITRTDSLTSNIHWYLLNELSAYSSNIWSFDADKNIYVSSQLADRAMIEFARGYLTSGKITSFEPYTVDSVLNSSLSNLSAAGQAKFDAKANVSNTVTTNTNQTITGQKAFTAELLKKSTVIDITTQAEKYTANNGVRFLDKNNNIMGFLENAQMASGVIKTGIHSKNKDGYQPNISVYAPLSGTTGAYATAPNTPDNAPANAIVTKDKITNMVTTNTAQTISAGKKISIGGTAAYGRPFEIMMPTSTESNPTENKAREIAFVASDGAGERYEGSLAHIRSTTGESYTGLRVGRLVNGTFKEGALGVKTIADGTSFAIAPTTPDNAPANAIVTKDKITNMVTTNTAQTISGVKTFSGGTLHANTPLLLKQNNANEGGEIRFERSNNSVLKDNPYIDLLTNTIRFIGTNSNNTVNITLQVDLQNNQVFVPTPATTANNTQAATTAWVNSKIQLVNKLPANPVAGVLYCIPEK